MQQLDAAVAEDPGVDGAAGATGQIAKFDLVLNADATRSGLAATWKYNTDLFDRTTISRLSGHLENLLSAAVADPETPIELLPLLSAAERHQLALEWNDTGSAYPAAASLPELFETQARNAPNAPAPWCSPMWWCE